MEEVAKLYCCICVYSRSSTAATADTVIRGYAVCVDHVGYVAQGTEWAVIMNTIRAQEKV